MRKTRPFTSRQRAAIRRRERLDARLEKKAAKLERREFLDSVQVFKRCSYARTEGLADGYTGTRVTGRGTARLPVARGKGGPRSGAARGGGRHTRPDDGRGGPAGALVRRPRQDGPRGGTGAEARSLPVPAAGVGADSHEA